MVNDDALKTLRLAYFAQDDFPSFQSLRRHSRELDGIIPDWLHLVRSGGKAEVVVDAHSEPGVVGLDTREVIAWLRNSAPKLSVYPLPFNRAQ
jgi:hypothetical protein